METQDEYSAQGSHFAGSHKVSHYYDTHIQKRQDKKKKKPGKDFVFFFQGVDKLLPFSKSVLSTVS